MCGRAHWLRLFGPLMMRLVLIYYSRDFRYIDAYIKDN